MDQNVIEHLFDVEREASELLSSAQAEYDKRLEAAHNETERQFKQEYEKIINENESRYEESIAVIKEEHQKKLDSYYSEVKSWPQNIQKLNGLLEKLFFQA